MRETWKNVLTRGCERSHPLPFTSSAIADLDARAVLSYAAVMHRGLSFTEVARQVGLARRSISRAIQRAQVAGLTGALPLPGLRAHTPPP